MFAAGVPSFNIRGQDSVKTTIGTCISMIIIFLTSGFALLKLQHMLLKKRPDVVQFTEEGAFDESTKYSLTDSDFIVAVSVEHWVKGATVDPRYIQFAMTYNF